MGTLNWSVIPMATPPLARTVQFSKRQCGYIGSFREGLSLFDGILPRSCVQDQQYLMGRGRQCLSNRPFDL